MSQNPCSQDFTGFTVHDSKSNDILGTFRADDIVQQRNFMAALGGKGPGLFTQSSGDSSEAAPVQLAHGSSLVGREESSKLQIRVRQVAFDSRTNDCTGFLPDYKRTVRNLAKEFYYPQDYQDNPDDITEASPLELSACSRTLQQVPEFPPHQRHVTDTFLPPHGPAVHRPVSIGYGAEIGLRSHLQAMWDTEHGVYYFLDHSARSAFLNDPRPRHDAVRSTCSPKTLEFAYEDEGVNSDLTFPAVCDEPSVVELAACRASRKPHGVVVKAFGKKGKAGTAGQSGRNGEMGTSGIIGINSDGEDGTDGTAGVSGESGRSGEEGGDGSDLSIQLSGDASALNMCINDQSCLIARLGRERNESVVFVDCHGGDGGEGGAGGVGGAGGKGGDGGNGGNRGCGGHGGDGGMGGAGGHGGAGGRAGSGGRCVVRTRDPRLLMLVEVDCRAGTGGRGGEGGRGGGGGRMGYGGEGGSWLEANSDSESGTRRVTGMRGKPGSLGSPGSNGQAGPDGMTGRDGGILWLVESASGNDILHQSGARYEAVVTSLKISPALHDAGTYEPNQPITVSGVTVKNTGGLPLPRGARLSFPTTETVRFEPVTYELPDIPPNTSFVVTESFRGRIFDQATPNLPGSFSGTASFSPQIELLGRTFENLLTETLPVSYPVKLSFALSKKNLSRGEISTLEVGIENTSAASYGSTSGCAGSLAVRFHLDSTLIPLGIQSPPTADSSTVPFRITHDPHIHDSIWASIAEIRPGETLSIPIAFLLSFDTQLCDTCVWQADLYFKGKLVEYKAQEIRVTPAYTPPSSLTSLGDVLMITSDSVSAHEFALWKRIYDILDVNVDFWDASQDAPPLYHPERTEAEVSDPVGPAQGASSASSSPVDLLSPFHSGLHPFNMYTGKAIVYPKCKLEQLPPEYIISHFNSSRSSTSSMVLFTPASNSISSSFESHYYDNTGHAQIFKHLCRVKDCVPLPDDAHSGYHLLTPGTLSSPDVAVKKSQRKNMKRLERNFPSQALAMFSGRSSNINQKGLCKYTYGAMDVRTFPIRRSCNFQCVDETGWTLTALGTDDPLLTVASKEFPLASKFGQVFLAVLIAIPLKCKLNIFKNSNVDKSSEGHVKFHLPNGAILNKWQLSAIAVAHTVADEILDCTGSSSRMKTVVEDLQTNKSLYWRNGSATVIEQMLALIQQEVQHWAQQLNCPDVLSTAKNIQKLCHSVATFYTSHVMPEANPTRPATTDVVLSKMNSVPVFPTTTKTDLANLISSRTLSCPSPGACNPPTFTLDGRGSTFTLHVPTSASPISSSSRSSSGGRRAKETPCLPPLRLLQDSIHILRTHQLLVEDNCYTVFR